MGCTFALRAVDKTVKYIFNKEIFEPENLQSETHKNQQNELAQLSMQMGDSGSRFAYETARFVNEFIPSFIAKELAVVPTATKGLLLYKSGMLVRYLNHLLERETKYDAKFQDSKLGKSLKNLYVRIRTCTAYTLTGETVLSQFVNIELLILHFLRNVKNEMSKNKAVPWIEAAFHSIANSVTHQTKIDAYLKRNKYLSWEEQFIGRLKWHQDNNCLPVGLPLQKGLTSQNLYERLDESLNTYLQKLTDELVTFAFPKEFTGLTSIIGTAYTLEGKQMLMALLTFLTNEYGIKQIANPHLFALAILKSFGVETMNFETDGFGEAKENLIFTTGLQMSKAPYHQVRDLYEQSLLDQAPGGFQTIIQKEAAKKALLDCLTDAIYEAIKTDPEFKHPGGFFKTLREKLGRMPVIGAATTSLHLLINGSFYALNYLFKTKGSNDSLLSHLFKNLSGRALAKSLAEPIVELIYHPSWRITLLQLMNDLIYALKNPGLVLSAKDNWPEKDFNSLVQFILYHYNQGSSLLYQSDIGSRVDGKSYLNAWITQAASQEGLIDKSLDALTPVIKELLIYIRVVDTYRKKGVIFDGDAKFWECFVREWLSRRSAQRRIDDLNRKPLNDYRKILVEELLALHGEKLREQLAITLEENFVPIGAIPQELINEDYFGARGNKLTEMPKLSIVQD